jgi:hypothetical protein
MPAPLVDIGYSQWVAIVKDDSVNFKGPNVLGQSSSAPGVMQNVGAALCDAIYVGGAGIVQAVGPDNLTCNFTCIAGQILPIKAIRVNSATTTATLMVALYK